MTHNSHESLPPTELPVPDKKNVETPQEAGVDGRVYTEASQSRATELNSASSNNPIPQPFSLPQAHPAPPSMALAGSLAPGVTPQIADDNDLIEKEWVLKAKEIVAHTKEDPYEQNKAMSRYKADYMKKRYNKDIKLTETD